MIEIQVQDCVNILCRYIDNIMGNPTEPKFHKIRCSNPTFADKVTPTLGATEFLYAAGFRLQKLDQNGAQEDFWVWSQENVEGLETLEVKTLMQSFVCFKASSEIYSQLSNPRELVTFFGF